VDDCRGVPLTGVGSQRCRHCCRQIPVTWLSRARSRGLRHELGDSGLSAPKLSCRPRWLHYISPDLGTTVLQHPLGVRRCRWRLLLTWLLGCSRAKVPDDRSVRPPRCELPAPGSFRIVPASQSVGSTPLGTVVAGPVAAPWCCMLAMGVSRPGLTAPEAGGLCRRELRRCQQHDFRSSSGRKYR
jgi:hypothetical protein